MNLVETNLAFFHHQRFGIRRVLDGRFVAEQPEQPFHIHQRLADLPIHEPQSIERYKQLQQVGVDHGEIPQGDLTTGHFLHRHRHDNDHRHTDDQGLARVQGRQRQPVFEPRLFPVIQILVVELCFEAFVIEVLDGLVVEQAVHRPGIGLVVAGIGFAHVFRAPLGNLDGKHHVHHHRHQNRQHIAHVEHYEENAGHQQDFQEGGYNIEEGKAQQKADAVGAPFNVPGQSAGFPVQMKGQLPVVQMFENPQRHASHGSLCHSRKSRVPQFTEQRAAKTKQAIGNDQKHWNPNQNVTTPVLVQVIDDVFQSDRCGDRCQFGEDQEPQCQHDSTTEFRQIGP